MARNFGKSQILEEMMAEALSQGKRVAYTGPDMRFVTGGPPTQLPPSPGGKLVRCDDGIYRPEKENL